MQKQVHFFAGEMNSVENTQKKSGAGAYVLLHGIILIYSFSMVMSKLAALETPFSLRFFLFYGLEIVFLGVYALFWQQIMKKIPLTTGYASKAVTVIWGILWGALLFGESITLGKLLGAALIIAGVVLFVRSDEPKTEVKSDEA